MSESRRTMGRGLNEWAAGLHGTAHEELAFQINEDKERTVANLRRLGLPHFGLITTSVQSFFENPDRYFDALGSRVYYVSINPEDTSMPRIRTSGLERDGTYAFVRETVEQNDPKYNNVLLMESYENFLFGGNITVSASANNEVNAEIAEGAHADLVGSLVTPKYTVARDMYTQKFLYNTDDPELRLAFFSAITAIPHTVRGEHAPGFESRGWHFEPGYYEFTLIKKETNQSLRPMFLDYSAQPPFQVPSSAELY